MRKTIYLQQVIIPDYRINLFRLLREEFGLDFEVFAGKDDFGGTPVSCDDAWEYFQHSKNYYLWGERFLWQIGCFSQLLSADLVILNSNMRILSNNLILLLRKLLGRRTILWGHATGKIRTADFFRRVYFRLSNGFIAYTETQKRMLSQNYPRLNVWIASNSCVSSKDCLPVQAEVEDISTILYVGRLIKSKKVRLLLAGYIYAREVHFLPENVRLVFVGDGDEHVYLKQQVDEASLSKYVKFSGHVSDISRLRYYYSKAICSVSPGYVGLSAIQSFSFGIPMLVARNENHSPEIEACLEGFNTQFFSSDDHVKLAIGLSAFFKEKSKWLKSRSSISEWTGKHYSFEAMKNAFANAITEVFA